MNSDNYHLMIRVTVELVPYGVEENKRVLGVCEIANDGTGSKTIGHYAFKIFKQGSRKVVWKKGRITDFFRGRRGAWDLLYLVLCQAVGYRNLT